MIPSLDLRGRILGSRVLLLLLGFLTLAIPERSRAATLVDIAAGNPNFSTLVTAVQAAGLAGTLSGPGPFTVFAPDNAAFAKLPPATLQALLADPEKLRKVLLYHVVPGRVRSGDLVAGPVVTAQGAAAKITLSPSPKIDAAGIVATDIEADNGVIHVIDSVILPPPSLVDIAAGNPNFSTLVTAVQAAGLAGTLTGPGPFTVFAPDNAAFAKLPPATLQALLADPETLRKVLLYHVVPGRVRSGDLVAGPLVTAQGAAAKITLSPSPKIDGAGIVATDVEADNGVIHVIDSVILPPPSLVEIAVGNPNFSTLVTAVQAAGLAGTLTGPGPFTVFAPDNAAFAKLPPATLQALLADPEKLRKVLLYHVVPGRVRSGDLVAGPLVTTQGAAAKITLSPSPKIDAAGIVATDIEAGNGVIHVIDSVILPPPSLVEIAAGNPNFSTLVTAVQAAGLADILTRTPGITVFAPDNAAFAKLPPGTLESLLANPERLRTVLLYHLVLGRVRSTDLAPGRVVTLQGAAARVNLESGVRINDSRVTSADIEASNGVLHVLDSVLLPPPDLVTLALATPQLSTFVAAVQAAGLAETFQAPGSYTVFAPSDDAFAKLPAGTLEALVADPERLRHLLLYHVHHGVRLRASDLRTGTVSTIQGAPLRVEVTPPSVTINGAAVLVPDGEAVNGVVHVVDSILFPGDGFVAASLSAVVKNGTVRLVWPAAVAGDAVLEAAAGPDGPWAAVGAPVTTGDGVNKVELNAAEDRRFFRLRAAVLSRSAVNPR